MNVYAETSIQNEIKQSGKPKGISFRRKDQLFGDVIWIVSEKVSQSYSRFNALDKLVVTVHSVRMPVGFGGSVKTMGRPISVMAHLKKSIIEFKDDDNCLAHALLRAISRLNNDSNYNSYCRGYKIRPVFQHLLETSGIDLTNGAGIPELVRFQEHFHEYKIVVYQGLSCEYIMFDGRVESSKRLNLLSDDVHQHYQVITKDVKVT